MKRDRLGYRTADLSFQPCFCCGMPAHKTLEIRPSREATAETGVGPMDVPLCSACAEGGDTVALERVKARVTPPPTGAVGR